MVGAAAGLELVRDALAHGVEVPSATYWAPGGKVTAVDVVEVPEVEVVVVELVGDDEVESSPEQLIVSASADTTTPATTRRAVVPASSLRMTIGPPSARRLRSSSSEALGQEPERLERLVVPVRPGVAAG